MIVDHLWSAVLLPLLIGCLSVFNFVHKTHEKHTKGENTTPERRKSDWLYDLTVMGRIGRVREF